MAQARIIDYSQRVTPGLGGAPRATAGAFATAGDALVGPGTDRLVRGLSDVQNRLVEIEEENAKAWATSALSKARLDWATQLIDRQSKADPAAADFTPKLLGDFDKYAEDTLGKAPNIASQNKISLKQMLTDFEAVQNLGQPIFAEGLGGWQVPINDTETMADYVKAIGFQVILVIPIRLGCLNHSILTERSIELDGLNVPGWISNQVDPDDPQCSDSDDNDGDDFITVVQTSQADTASLTTADYDQCGAISNPTEGATRIDIGSITIGAYNSWTLNATGLGWISKTGYTFLGLREGHDAINSAITFGINRVKFAGSEATGTANDPYLDVTSSAGGGETVTLDKWFMQYRNPVDRLGVINY